MYLSSAKIALSALSRHEPFLTFGRGSIVPECIKICGKSREGGSADLMSRFTNDMETIGNGMKILFGRVIGEPLRALACLGIAMWISWQLTILFVLIVPAAIIVMTTASKKMKKASRRVVRPNGDDVQDSARNVSGSADRESVHHGAVRAGGFTMPRRIMRDKSVKVVRIDAMTGPLVEVTGDVAVSLGIAGRIVPCAERRRRRYSASLTSQPIESPMLFQLYTLLIGIADPIRKLSSVYTKFQAAAAACDRVFLAMDRLPEVQPNPDGPRLDRHCKEIEFQNVCFSYVRERQVLTNICLRVQAARRLRSSAPMAAASPRS